MRIAVIGAGMIGGILAGAFSRSEHDVQIANSRGPATLAALARDTGARPATPDAAVDGADAVVLAVPFGRLSDLADLVATLPAATVVADTSNYFPARDGRIAEVESGMPESVYVQAHLHHPIVRAWNALTGDTLATKGTAAGHPGRLAIPVAGDRAEDKLLVTGLIDDSGFDAVDAGVAADSWRQQAGAPAYCTELTRPELARALARTDPETATARRDAIFRILDTWQTPSTGDQIVTLNRAVGRVLALSGSRIHAG